ncbi:hypothetical protein E2F48_10175 [Arthrobacter crusticola]|uniref:DUF6314 domain-containing protein n=1 Tax=Arthrobacter crusticola TaxID=2547960 RepID=A0A4R5TWS5_9MICC|nr:DUF6314 family protein [Arthrobacter crusticola]TDK25603.1 hypothetical protein E2F48_10175 [Arthrobacter crusticola]
MNVPVPDLRSYLLGAWRVRRSLLNRADATVGTFTGTLTFRPVPDGGPGLFWHEEGTVHWPGVRPSTGRAVAPFTGPASRRYLLVPGGPAAPWEVLFEDGRPFHRLGLTTGSWRDEHWCSPDTYRVEYTALAQDRLNYEWDVTGPAKDQLLTTELTREDPTG